MFTFDEKKHIYELEGKPLTGITTILGVIAKPALVGWAARMASDYILNNLTNLDDLEKVCEAAKSAHRRKKEEAGQKGTDIHAEIETGIKEAIEMNNGYLADINTDNQQIKNFYRWAEKNKVKFLASEKRLYSRKYWIAGTCDFICEIDGKRYVGDIKTSSGIYDRTPHFQTAGYRIMLEEIEGEKPIDGSVIINIKKNGEFSDDDVYYSYSYDDDKEGFLAALTLYRKLQTFKVAK